PLPFGPQTSLRLHERALEHLGSERDNLHEVTVAQLAGNWPEDTRPARVVAGRDDDGRVLVELDGAAVGPTVLLRRAHDHGRDHLALLDGAVRRGLLHRSLDEVTHAGPALVGCAHHADAHDLLGPGVVGHLEPCLWHDHALLLLIFFVFVLVV